MAFTLLRATLGGKVLLERDRAEPATRRPLFNRRGERVGVVLETIGRVDKPLYVADVDEKYSRPGTVFEEER